MKDLAEILLDGNTVAQMKRKLDAMQEENKKLAQLVAIYENTDVVDEEDIYTKFINAQHEEINTNDYCLEEIYNLFKQFIDTNLSEYYQTPRYNQFIYNTIILNRMLYRTENTKCFKDVTRNIYKVNIV